jgi:hypothetical protein
MSLGEYMHGLCKEEEAHRVSRGRPPDLYSSRSSSSSYRTASRGTDYNIMLNHPFQQQITSGVP